MVGGFAQRPPSNLRRALFILAWLGKFCWALTITRGDGMILPGLNLILILRRDHDQSD